MAHVVDSRDHGLIGDLVSCKLFCRHNVQLEHLLEPNAVAQQTTLDGFGDALERFVYKQILLIEIILQFNNFTRLCRRFKIQL